jgi:SAM-dependent methyltransferase
MQYIHQTKRLYFNLGYVTVFMYFRFCHAPYKLLESLVPKQGKIIDLGCGYGFFSNLLGLASPEREVIGIEISSRKLKYAPRGVSNVKFVNADITKMDIEDCDAIVLIHVLHHLRSYQEQEILLNNCYKRLRGGGKLIVAEIDRHPFWKYLFSVFIDNTLYFGDRFFFRTEEGFKDLFTRIGFKVEKILPAHKKVPLSHKIFVCTK